MMSEKIEFVLVKRKMSKSALAEALNSSPSNLYNKVNYPLSKANGLPASQTSQPTISAGVNLG